MHLHLVRWWLHLIAPHLARRTGDRKHKTPQHGSPIRTHRIHGYTSLCCFKAEPWRGSLCLFIYNHLWIVCYIPFSIFLPKTLDHEVFGLKSLNWMTYRNLLCRWKWLLSIPELVSKRKQHCHTVLAGRHQNSAYYNFHIRGSNTVFDSFNLKNKQTKKTPLQLPKSFNTVSWLNWNSIKINISIL